MPEGVYGVASPGRLIGHDTVSTSLALRRARGDAELRELVDAATPLGTGIGGKPARLEVSVRRCFGVKSSWKGRNSAGRR
ncbi:hypothetical protein [Streptomyces purpurascens]|uniref:hypothetical protein n=1 Tax=Streptomyces purpurascens TaxID=1924 RepID=UPI0016745E65|nr:hypothetical protein GCM10010303_72950 [Streptomyces purpurascens]